MKPLIVTVSLLILAGLIATDVAGYRAYQVIRADFASLKSSQVETHELAEQANATARAVGIRAEEAVQRAELAAGARKQAEAARDSAVNQAQQAQTQAQQAQTQAQQAESQMQSMRREREEELQRMQEALNKIAETKRTPSGMIMFLPDSMFRFDFDKADLTAKNRELLSRVAGVLLVSKGYSLAIHGYTDDVGTADYNKQLSLRRAKAVADFLIGGGVDRSIITTSGFGKNDPRVQGTSDQARERNRRVEIAVIDTAIQYGGETVLR